ncbi:MAG: lysophospholipase [Desulfobacterales bacterium]|nr:lysophospholipase [Desulfobacterales bacterium]
MKHNSGFFDGPRGLRVFYQSWVPDAEVRFVFLLVHGMGEHSGRYMNLVDHFLPLGAAVYTWDHVGHGLSQGKRERINTFKDYTDTLDTCFRRVQTQQPDIPVFLIGHSMGGAIALDYLLDHQAPFRGAILSAPALKPPEKVSILTLAAGKLLSKVAPGFGILALDLDAVSRDPQVREDYIRDPLTFKGRTPVRLAVELLEAMDRIDRHARRITLPFIILQGTHDRLVDPEGAAIIFEKAGSTDKTLKEYEGLFHEVFNEPEHGQVLADVENWVDRLI